MSAPLRIAIFASGRGSNARQLLAHFQDSEVAEVAVLLTNRPDSGAFDLGRSFAVPCLYLKADSYRDGPYLLRLLREYQIDLVVLAGYLKLIPRELIEAYPRRILNIHPSLLPAYGGQGMYGGRVHQAIIDNQEAYSGITIHYVDEVYDQGEVIFQERLLVDPNWDAEALQQAIHRLEHTHFPAVVEKVCHEVLTNGDKF